MILISTGKKRENGWIATHVSHECLCFYGRKRGQSMSIVLQAVHSFKRVHRNMDCAAAPTLETQHWYLQPLYKVLLSFTGSNKCGKVALTFTAFFHWETTVTVWLQLWINCKSFNIKAMNASVKPHLRSLFFLLHLIKSPQDRLPVRRIDLDKKSVQTDNIDKKFSSWRLPGVLDLLRRLSHVRVRGRNLLKQIRTRASSHILESSWCQSHGSDFLIWYLWSRRS